MELKLWELVRMQLTPTPTWPGIKIHMQTTGEYLTSLGISLLKESIRVVEGLDTDYNSFWEGFRGKNLGGLLIF